RPVIDITIERRGVADAQHTRLCRVACGLLRDRARRERVVDRLYFLICGLLFVGRRVAAAGAEEDPSEHRDDSDSKRGLVHRRLLSRLFSANQTDGLPVGWLGPAML